MNNYFTYSLLQYKHSISLGELINVGILFYFPDKKKIEFVTGDSTRAKAIYPDFNPSLFKNYLSTIQSKSKQVFDLFNQDILKADFSKIIHDKILAIDAAGLVFSPPVHVNNAFKSIESAIESYSKILLPGINVIQPSVEKFNDSYILKTFKGYILDKNKELFNKLDKNKVIETNQFKIVFNYAWKSSNNISNYVKPLSFDLPDEASIQNKAALHGGYLLSLLDYYNSANSRFDFLVFKPRNKELFKVYDNAIAFLHKPGANVRIFQDNKWNTYCEEILENIN